MKWFLTITTIVVVAAFYAVLFIEWAAGCGESYTDSKGVTHTNECVFINRGK
jgi:hypothetical protein